MGEHDDLPHASGRFAAPLIEVDTAPSRGLRYDAVVHLLGEHDIGTSPAIEHELAALHGSVLVDLSRCHFIDSTVIRNLLRKVEELRREGHALELVAPAHNGIARTLEVSGVRGVLVVHDGVPPTR
jgi:anti-anti-sigma factor